MKTFSLVLTQMNRYPPSLVVSQLAWFFLSATLLVVTMMLSWRGLLAATGWLGREGQQVRGLGVGVGGRQFERARRPSAYTCVGPVGQGLFRGLWLFADCSLAEVRLAGAHLHDWGRAGLQTIL